MDSEPPVYVQRWHWALIAALSAVGIFYGSLLPFTFQTLRFTDAVTTYRSLLSAGPAAYYSRQDVAVNVLIAVPLAFALMGSVLMRCRRFLPLVSGTVLVLVACLVVSFLVEFAQLWVPSRVSSVRDVAAQVTGASVGCILWLLFGPAMCDRLDEFIGSREQSTRIVWLLNAYVIGLVIWSLLPFDVATNLDQIARKYPRGQIELIPFSFRYRTPADFWYAMMTDAAIFIPIGIWSFVAWVRRESSFRNPWSAAVLCLGVNVGIESLQLVIRSRYTSTTDVMIGMVGSVVGIVGMQLWIRFREHAADARRSTFETAGFWIVACIFCSIGLLAFNWMPYHITRDPAVIRERLRNFAEVPFRTLQATQSDSSAMFHIIRNLSWYVPLGGLAALAVYRSVSHGRLSRSLLTLAALAVSAVAFTGELGRILFSEKPANLTDALVRTTGGVLGLIITAFVMSRWKPH